MPYQHTESQDNVQVWDKNPQELKVKQGSDSQVSRWSLEYLLTLTPLYSAMTGQGVSGPWMMMTSFFAVFFLGIYCVKRYCLGRPRFNSTVIATSVMKA